MWCGQAYVVAGFDGNVASSSPSVGSGYVHVEEGSIYSYLTQNFYQNGCWVLSYTFWVFSWTPALGLPGSLAGPRPAAPWQLLGELAQQWRAVWGLSFLDWDTFHCKEQKNPPNELKSKEMCYSHRSRSPEVRSSWLSDSGTRPSQQERGPLPPPPSLAFRFALLAGPLVTWPPNIPETDKQVTPLEKRGPLVRSFLESGSLSRNLRLPRVPEAASSSSSLWSRAAFCFFKTLP